MFEIPAILGLKKRIPLWHKLPRNNFLLRITSERKGDLICLAYHYSRLIRSLTYIYCLYLALESNGACGNHLLVCHAAKAFVFNNNHYLGFCWSCRLFVFIQSSTKLPLFVTSICLFEKIYCMHCQYIMHSNFINRLEYHSDSKSLLDH